MAAKHNRREPVSRTLRAHVDDAARDHGNLRAAQPRGAHGHPGVRELLCVGPLTMRGMEEALRLARELNRKHPDRADGFALLAQLLFSQGQTEEAIALSEDAVTRHPRESALHVMLYLLHLTSEDAEKATAALDRFSQIDPEARMRIAEALLQAMQIEPAVALMEEELRVRPERMEVAMTLAQLHRYQGNSEAITRLRAHIGEHAPDRDAALVSFDKALEEIDSQLQSTPQPSDVQNGPDAPVSPPGDTKPPENDVAPEARSSSPSATSSTP